MFTDRLREISSFEDAAAKIEAVSVKDVERLLASENFTIDNIHILLSENADIFLEDMANLSKKYTEQRFGKIIKLYAPLYLSNVCTNSCVYCGFSASNKDAVRKTLLLDEAEREFQVIREMGIQHILLVSGEAPSIVDVNYLENAISCGLKYASQIYLEVYPLSEDGYARLCRAGAEGVTLYQETYDPVMYKRLHKGKKADIEWRLNALDRACGGGMIAAGVGALLGLNNPRADVYFAALHAEYLRNRYWKTEVSVSFPRLRDYKAGVHYPVSDRELLRFITAVRLTLKEAGITISTREKSVFRDNLVGLGVTQMSAASSTMPGGYAERTKAAEQFYISDGRSVEEVQKAIKKRGYMPIYKDRA